MKDMFAAFGAPVRNSEALKNVSTVKKFAAKAMILGEKDKGDFVYFILEGKVDITSFSSGGREVWHSRLSAGQQFGEMAVLTDSLRSANVVSVSKTTAAVITQTQFATLIENDNELCLWFLKNLAQRLEDSTRQIYELVALNIPKRVCAELVRRTQDEPDHNNEYPLSPSPVLAQMARRLNTDRETISRAISNLIKDGLIRKSGRQITVLNKNALLKRAIE